MISKNQQKLIRSLSLKKNRERERLFVAEGPKVVADLQHAGFVAEQLYAIPDVSEEEMQRVSFLQHPQGVIALFR